MSLDLIGDWDSTPLLDPSIAFNALDGTEIARPLELAANASKFDNLPIDQNPRATGAQLAGTFGGDFFDRIHASARTLDLGNLVGNQVRTFSLWNAYGYGITITGLSVVGADGVSLTGQPDPPLPMLAFQERDYTITLGLNGPPTLDAIYAWTFDTGATRVLELIGRRVIGWGFAPAWANGILERLEWSTNVIPAFNGKEQRRKLRKGARRAIEFDAVIDGAVRRKFDATLWGWQARNFAIPLWWDGIPLAADLALGATSIPLDPALREFAPGGLALLRGGDTSLEVVEILTASGSIGLRSPTANAWPAGTMVYPAIVARADQAVQVNRFTHDADYFRLRFDAAAATDYAADPGATTFLGYPVVTLRPRLSGDMSASFERRLDVIDNGTAYPFVDDETQIPMMRQRNGWATYTRAELAALYGLLFYFAGRYGAAWVPTWADDLIVKATIASGAGNIDVESVGYTTYVNQDPGRGHLRMELASGAVYYFKITGSSAPDDATDRLSISPNAPATINPADIVQLSYLQLMRLDGDGVELVHWTGDAAELTADFRGFRHDL